MGGVAKCTPCGCGPISARVVAAARVGPLRIFHIALTATQVAHMARIDDHETSDPFPFLDCLVHLAPVDAGAFHGNVVAFMRIQPIHQPDKFPAAGPEPLAVDCRIFQPSLDDTGFDHVFVVVQENHHFFVFSLDRLVPYRI